MYPQIVRRDNMAHQQNKQFNTYQEGFDLEILKSSAHETNIYKRYADMKRHICWF